MKSERIAMRRGYVQVYTGNGKGKTTASIGLCVRASGSGLKVLFAQFLKGSDYSEIKALKKIPGISLEQYGTGLGLLMPGMDKSKHANACREGLLRAKKAISSGIYDLVVLDEINCAADLDLISTDDIIDIIDAKPEGCELVLTGRNAAPEIIDRAALVTEMREVKHYYQKGVPAREGIEH